MRIDFHRLSDASIAFFVRLGAHLLQNCQAGAHLELCLRHNVILGGSEITTRAGGRVRQKDIFRVLDACAWREVSRAQNLVHERVRR